MALNWWKKVDGKSACMIEQTWKSRISEICTRCQIWGVHSPTFGPDPRNELKHFPIMGGLSANSFWANLQWQIWANQQTGGNFADRIEEICSDAFQQICQIGGGNSASRFEQICKLGGGILPADLSKSPRFEQFFLTRLIGEWIQRSFTKDQKGHFKIPMQRILITEHTFASESCQYKWESTISPPWGIKGYYLKPLLGPIKMQLTTTFVLVFANCIESFPSHGGTMMNRSHDLL